ncbi:MAG: 3-oxoadipyl-CoA thiolase [Phycisphaerales bacterium]|nr:3-oxoadipyl-CoA thiolase [Phycisphaerales bacterium]
MIGHPAFIVEAARTPIGRYGGALAHIRADDLAALPIRALMDRHPRLDWGALDEVILGCANQAGEDNRNVARMALLLAGLPAAVPGVTVNRLCGSGMEAIAQGARLIAAGEAHLVIAGGVESMSRAPWVMPKASEAYSRDARVFDTTIGWRFINPRMHERHGTDAMPETAEIVARQCGITRAEQDAFAAQSQARAARAIAEGHLAREIIPVPSRQDPSVSVRHDEHPRPTTIEKLASLKPITTPQGTITAGNASGVNDGAAAVLLASEAALISHGLTPLARVLGAASAGVEPRVMGLGPIPATQRLLARLGLALRDFEVIELNEAFAAQAIACARGLDLSPADPRLNPLGGAIALGHPLGMSGTRLVGTGAHQLARTGVRRALCTMCVGVGQGIAMAIERAG